MSQNEHRIDLVISWALKIVAVLMMTLSSLVFYGMYNDIKDVKSVQLDMKVEQAVMKSEIKQIGKEIDKLTRYNDKQTD
jgi:hypothetical protein